jgi:hypothetical protein
LRSEPKVPNLLRKFVNIRSGSFSSERGQLDDEIIRPEYFVFQLPQVFEIRKGL